MTAIQPIIGKTKYDHIFCRVLRDRKLANTHCQIKSGNLYAHFDNFFVTYLSFCNSVYRSMILAIFAKMQDIKFQQQQKVNEHYCDNSLCCTC